MEDKLIAGYRFLVTNPDRFGGRVTIAGTRFSVSFILACLAEGMSYEDIVREYSDFPRESVAEVLRFAAEVTDSEGLPGSASVTVTVMPPMTTEVLAAADEINDHPRLTRTDSLKSGCSASDHWRQFPRVDPSTPRSTMP